MAKTTISFKTDEEIKAADAQAARSIDNMRQVLLEKMPDLVTNPLKTFSAMCTAIEVANKALKEDLPKVSTDYSDLDLSAPTPEQAEHARFVMRSVGFPLITVLLIGEIMLKQMQAGGTSLVTAEMDQMARRAGMPAGRRSH